MRESAVDLYYSFSSLLPANLAFGIGLIVLVVALAGSSLGWVLAVVLVPLAAGCMALATTLVRDHHTDLGEYAAVIRRPGQVLVLGAFQLGAGLVLVVDLLVGAAVGSVPGGIMLLSSLFGLVILWAYSIAAWPIVLDPWRRDEPIGARLRLALVLLVRRPIGLPAFALLLGAFLVAASVVFAVIVTFGFAFACLVAARYVLPAGGPARGAGRGGRRRLTRPTRGDG